MIVRDPNDLSVHTEIHPRVIELYQRPFFKQGTKQWLEQRESFLTASDVGAVLGNCIFKDRSIVHGQKLGTIPPEEQTEAMRHGTMTEPEARKEYERITGNKVIQFGLLTGTQRLHFIGASVDGITTDGIVVEIKCPYSRKIKQGVVPSYYHDQVQTQLAVCDLDIAHYFEYNSFDGTYNLVEVKRDLNWLDKNKRTLMDFWAGIELEQKLRQYVEVLDEKDNLEFFNSVYLPRYAEFELEKMKGNIQDASAILTHLGIACCHSGYAHYQKAISCFIDAEQTALSIKWLEGFVFANLNRALVYCELGMKWYGVPLLLMNLRGLENLENKNRTVLSDIVQLRRHLGYAYSTWIMGHEQDQTCLMLGILMYLTANDLCKEHRLDINLEEGLKEHEKKILSSVSEETASALLTNREAFEEILSKVAY